MTGAELKAARKRMGLSLARLGDLIGRSEGGLSRYENGKTPIPPIVEKVVVNLEQVMKSAVTPSRKRKI